MENDFMEKIKDEATRYGKALGEVGKLHLIGIVSRVLGLFLLIFTLVLCSLALFTFGAVAAIDAMSVHMPVWTASLIIGSAYLVLIIVAILCRKPLFIHPFIALLSKQLIHTQEELELKKIKAEYEVEKQTVRIETRVENATREINFYVNFVSRLWNWFTSLRKK